MCSVFSLFLSLSLSRSLRQYFMAFCTCVYGLARYLSLTMSSSSSSSTQGTHSHPVPPMPPPQNPRSAPSASLPTKSFTRMRVAQYTRRANEPNPDIVWVHVTYSRRSASIRLGEEISLLTDAVHSCLPSPRCHSHSSSGEMYADRPDEPHTCRKLYVCVERRCVRQIRESRERESHGLVKPKRFHTLHHLCGCVDVRLTLDRR